MESRDFLEMYDKLLSFKVNKKGFYIGVELVYFHSVFLHA